MKLGVMQPYFFPYLGYYQAISAVDKYILYDHVAYIKDGWLNRNRFLVARGEPAYFVVAVKQKSSFKKISEMELVEDNEWRRKILNLIFFNYKKRPFFDEVYPIIQRVINAQVRLLSELNALSITEVCNYLDTKTDIIIDAGQYLPLEEKLAEDGLEISVRFPSIDLNNPEKKVIRVIEICRAEGAEIYVNAIGGQQLYDKEEFARNNIQLSFLQTNPYSYQQSTRIFYPHLSIIDVLMNCGKDGTNRLINEYALV